MSDTLIVDVPASRTLGRSYITTLTQAQIFTLRTSREVQVSVIAGGNQVQLTPSIPLWLLSAVSIHVDAQVSKARGKLQFIVFIGADQQALSHILFWAQSCGSAGAVVPFYTPTNTPAFTARSIGTLAQRLGISPVSSDTWKIWRELTDYTCFDTIAISRAELEKASSVNNDDEYRNALINAIAKARATGKFKGNYVAEIVQYARSHPVFYRLVDEAKSRFEAAQRQQ